MVRSSRLVATAVALLSAAQSRAQAPPVAAESVEEAIPCDHEEVRPYEVMRLARLQAGLPSEADLGEGPLLAGGASVRLEAVDVWITMVPAASPYQGRNWPRERRITWQVVNAGPAREVTLRFPYTWSDPPPRGPTGPSTEGLELVGEVGVGDAGWLDCDAGRLTGAEWVEPTGLEARAFCETRVRLPAGPSTLVVRTRSPRDQNWLLEGGRRAVAYGFTAERALGGRPREVTLTLAPFSDGWKDGVIPSLPGGGLLQADGSLRWRFERPDLAALKLFATVPAASAWGRRAIEALGTGFTARASSALRPQGRFRFDAAEVLDGDPATAWCEGARGVGAGEWLEVTANLTARGVRACDLDGFVLLPGHAASRAAWRRNGRAARVRIAPCAEPGGGATFDLSGSGPFEREADGVPFDPGAAQLLPIPQGPSPQPRMMPGPPLLKASDGCWRLTVLEVVKGEDPDLCVAEFQPIFSCPR